MKFLKNLMQSGTKVAMGVGGGLGSRAVANKVMPMIPVVKDHQKFHNGINFLLGTALYDMTKGSAPAFGYAVVAGTDAVSDFVPFFKPANAIAENIEGMGEELAEALEEKINKDVSSEAGAMNGDVNGGAMNDDNDGMNDDNDGVHDNDD